MSWTKRQYCLQAFDETGFGSDEFAVGPERMQSARRKLDSMIEFWVSDGINIPYPSAGYSTDDLDTETRIPKKAQLAAYLGLAILIAGSVGKVPSSDLKGNYRKAYQALRRKYVRPNTMQFPRTTLLGAGNKVHRWVHNPFVDLPDERRRENRR